MLINFILLDRLDLLGALPGLCFLVPREVETEIRRPPQPTKLRQAFDAGHLTRIDLNTGALIHFAELRRVMERGEAACLAVAFTRDALVASDEKRAFLREARRLLGTDRILNTPGLLLLAIRKGLLTVDEADRAKEFLANNRFHLKMRSFQDLI